MIQNVVLSSSFFFYACRFFFFFFFFGPWAVFDQYSANISEYIMNLVCHCSYSLESDWLWLVGAFDVHQSFIIHHQLHVQRFEHYTEHGWLTYASSLLMHCHSWQHNRLSLSPAPLCCALLMFSHHALVYWFTLGCLRWRSSRKRLT